MQNLEYKDVGEFREGLAYFSCDGQYYGYINTKGEVVIEPKWYRAGAFRNGFAKVGIKIGKYGLINTKGEVVIEPAFDDVQNLHHGMVALALENSRKQKRWAICNINKKSNPFIFQSVYSNSDASIDAYTEGLRWEIVANNGELQVLKTQLTSDAKLIPFFKDKLIFENEAQEILLEVDAYIDGKQHDIDQTCEKLNATYYFVQKWGFANPKDLTEFIIEAKWDDISGFKESFAPVCKNDKWGFIDENGNVAIDLVWDDVCDFEDGLARVTQDGKQGIIDKSGNIIVEPIYEYILSFNEGFAVARKDFCAYVHIDKSGNVLNIK